MCIEHLRNEIDKIDERLIELLKERLILCNSIGEIKKQNGLCVAVPHREREIIKKIKNNQYCYEEHVVEIMKKIFEESKKIQQRIL